MSDFFSRTEVVSKPASPSAGNDFFARTKLVSRPAPMQSPIVETARKWLGTPYKWGAASWRATDCSGLTQNVMKEHGIKLPRVAADQYTVTQRVERAEAQPGDLVFLQGTGGKKPGKISHVGIYTGDGKFIHAAAGGKRRKVIEDRLDTPYNRAHFDSIRRPSAEMARLAGEMDVEAAKQKLSPLQKGAAFVLGAITTGPGEPDIPAAAAGRAAAEELPHAIVRAGKSVGKTAAGFAAFGLQVGETVGSMAAPALPGGRATYKMIKEFQRGNRERIYRLLPDSVRSTVKEVVESALTPMTAKQIAMMPVDIIKQVVSGIITAPEQIEQGDISPLLSSLAMVAGGVHGGRSLLKKAGPLLEGLRGTKGVELEVMRDLVDKGYGTPEMERLLAEREVVSRESAVVSPEAEALGEKGGVTIPEERKAFEPRPGEEITPETATGPGVREAGEQMLAEDTARQAQEKAAYIAEKMPEVGETVELPDVGEVTVREIRPSSAKATEGGALAGEIVAETAQGMRIRVGAEEFVRMREEGPAGKQPAVSGQQPRGGAEAAGRIEEVTEAETQIRRGELTAATLGPETEMPTQEIIRDPVRFQFKESNPPADVPYNPLFADVIDVWRDPADGKTYVVNGHKRHAWALRDNAPTMRVRYIEAATAEAAKVFGAVKNIAQGSGTPVDAARLFRQTGLTAEELLAQGLDLTGAVARDGMNLSRLSDTLFHEVAIGKLPVERGALIGELLPDHADQAALIKALAKRENVTNDVLREFIKQAQGAPKTEVTQRNLFGDEVIRTNLLLEKAEVSAYIRQQLRQDQAAFGGAAKHAERLRAGNNIIDEATSRAIATEARQIQDIYDRLSEYKGPVAEALNEAAGRIANGESKSTVKAETYQRVKAGVSETLAGREGAGTVAVEGAPGRGPAETPEPVIPPPTALEPPLIQATREGQMASGLLESPEDFQLTSQKAAESRIPVSGKATMAAGEEAGQMRLEGKPAGEAAVVSPEPVVEAPPSLVQRVEEPGVPGATVDKPHGIYTTPAEYKSPHAELGGEISQWRTNPEAKVLTVDTTALYETNRGLAGQSAGVAALRQLIGDEGTSNLAKMSKGELQTVLAREYPDVEWNRYFDQAEMLEGYAGLLARRQGHDAIWGFDKQAPEMSEYVALTDRAMTPAKLAPTRAKVEPAAGGKPAGQGTLLQRGAGTIAVSRPEARVKAEAAVAVRASDIVKELDRAFAPIRVGRFREMASGIFKVKQRVIRTGKANDLYAISHEVGHSLHKLLYPEAKTKHGKALSGEAFPAEYRGELESLAYPEARDKVVEGYAEYIRLRLTEPAEAASRAPKFHEYFREKLSEFPDVMRVLDRAQENIRLWKEQPAAARVRSTVSRDQKGNERGWSIDRLYKTFVDELHPLYKAEREITGGAKIPIEESAFGEAWRARGLSGKAKEWLEHGITDESGKKVGKGLKEILDPVAGEFDNFGDYVYSVHALDVIADGKAMPLGKADYQAVVDKAPAHYGTALKELVGYQDALLQELVDAGMLSAEAKVAMRAKWPNHVPLYRDMQAPAGRRGTGKAPANLPQAVKKLRGSGRDVIDPIESIVKDTYVFLNLAQRNRVMSKLVGLAEKFEDTGRVVELDIPPKMRPTSFTLDEVLRKEEKVIAEAVGLDLDAAKTVFRPSYMPAGRENIVAVYIEGKPRLFQLDKELHAAVTGQDVLSSNILIDLLSTPAKVLRAGATLTPEFAMRNPVRDVMTAVINSEYGLMPYDFIRGLFHVLRRDDLYHQFKASGAAHADMISVDRNYLQKSIREIVYNSPSEKVIDFLKEPLEGILEPLRAFSQATEEATRVTEFGLGTKWGKETEIGKIMEAAISARDVTLDFSRAGTAGKQMNRWTAFLNANIQGVDKMAREAKTHPRRFFTRGVAYITVPTVALYYMNRNDPRYQERAEWEKDVYWFIPTPEGQPLYRIPKPFEYGILFGSTVERALRWIDAKDPHAFDEFGKDVFGAATPDILPTALIPWVQVISNRSFSGRPIVPRSEQDLPAALQVGPGTSAIAEIIGRRFDLSPRKLDAYISGYGGGLGKQAVGTTGWALEQLGVIGDRAPEAARPILARVPGVRGFVANEMSQPVQVDRMYDRLDDLRDSKKKADAKIGKPLTEGEREELRALEHRAEVLSHIRKVERTVMEATEQEALSELFGMYDIPAHVGPIEEQKRAALLYLRLKQRDVATGKGGMA